MSGDILKSLKVGISKVGIICNPSPKQRFHEITEILFIGVIVHIQHDDRLL